MAVIPFVIKCATPDCDTVAVITDAEDFAGWSLLEDGDDAWWLCPDCPIEED